MSGSWNSSGKAVVSCRSLVVGSERHSSRIFVTLEELEKTLPNGLHDSRVGRIAIDYEKRELTLDLEVWVGDMDSDAHELREAYRPGQVLIEGRLFAVLEPPHAEYPFLNSVGLTIDGCDMRKNLSAELMDSLPADAFFRSLWVNEWNAFIHIGARNVELAWTGDSSAHRQKPEASRWKPE
jgi:hypothetical protein